MGTVRNPGDELLAVADQAAAPPVNARDDRVFTETRALAVVIVPFLLVAFGILYGFPERTKELFSWGISPPMSALMLGSAYLGGAYYFIRVAVATRWHEVALGFPAVAAFASLMGISTALHWDRFTHDHVSFVAWVALYAVTPFLVLAAWLRNRRTDPGTQDAQDVVLPQSVRLGVGVVGAVTLLVALLLFLQPALMVSVWPWPLTPLTARVLGGLFALPGVFGLGMAIDPRWSAARVTLQSQVVALAFIVAAIARTWSSFDQANPLTWVLCGGLAGMLVALVFLHVWMDRGRRRGA